MYQAKSVALVAAYPGQHTLGVYPGQDAIQGFGSGTPSNFQSLPGSQPHPGELSYQYYGHQDPYRDGSMLGQAPPPVNITESSALRGGYGASYSIPENPRTQIYGGEAVHPSVHEHSVSYGSNVPYPYASEPRMPQGHHHQGYPLM